MNLLFAVFMFLDFSWVPTDDARQVALYQDNLQVGVFKVPERVYLEIDSKGEFKESTLPTPVPQKYLDLFPTKKILNYGIDLSELKGKPESYYHNGRAITKESALSLMGTQDIPDDSEFLRLTVIGPDAIRKRVRDDLFNDPALSDFKSFTVVQDYPPSHWAVADIGFELTGEVAIYVQSPDGTVLHKQNDYKDGAVGLAAALRKVDPNYRRGGDPDLRGTLEGSLLVFVIVITLVLAVFFFRRSDEQ
jgi:hypothetical protein